MKKKPADKAKAAQKDEGGKGSWLRRRHAKDGASIKENHQGFEPTDNPRGSFIKKLAPRRTKTPYEPQNHSVCDVILALAEISLQTESETGIGLPVLKAERKGGTNTYRESGIFINHASLEKDAVDYIEKEAFLDRSNATYFISQLKKNHPTLLFTLTHKSPLNLKDKEENSNEVRLGALIDTAKHLLTNRNLGNSKQEIFHANVARFFEKNKETLKGFEIGIFTYLLQEQQKRAQNEDTARVSEAIEQRWQVLEKAKPKGEKIKKRSWYSISRKKISSREGKDMSGELIFLEDNTCTVVHGNNQGSLPKKNPRNKIQRESVSESQKEENWHAIVAGLSSEKLTEKEDDKTYRERKGKEKEVDKGNGKRKKPKKHRSNKKELLDPHTTFQTTTTTTSSEENITVTTTTTVTISNQQPPRESWRASVGVSISRQGSWEIPSAVLPPQEPARENGPVPANNLSHQGSLNGLQVLEQTIPPFSGKETIRKLGNLTITQRKFKQEKVGTLRGKFEEMATVSQDTSRSRMSPSNPTPSGTVRGLKTFMEMAANGQKLPSTRGNGIA